MSNTTSLTLLGRLKSPHDQEAWRRFARLYTPLLYHWCRRVGLQPHDAADLVQDVFLLLVRKLPGFQYDRRRSFRNWLRTVTMNKWRERARRKALQTVGIAGDVEEPAERKLDWRLEATEYRAELVRSALPLIEPEFSEASWQAFMRHAVQGEQASAVAARLGLSVGSVYSAKSRVLSRLRQELMGLLDE